MERKQLLEIRNSEKLNEIRGVLRVISNNMVMPLYFFFWIADLFYFPDKKWTFLGIRASVIPVSLIVRALLQRVSSTAIAEYLALFYIASLASTINWMIFLIGDFSTPYYAGLNLVALGCLTFFPWSKSFYFLTVLAIYGPYYIGMYLSNNEQSRQTISLVNSFFVASTVLISFFIRYFNEEIRIKELVSRINLNEEISNRNQVIIERTDESVKLATLARQFSPQVVHSIRTGKIPSLTSINRSMICAIFVDIVNSTDRVVRIDKENLRLVIGQFMKDSMEIFLKYDITIDKFLGDGILGFSNAPIERDDFVERAAMCAFEVRERIIANRAFYLDNWLAELQIRTGIASGFADVGFFGSADLYTNYTAIGKVVNLASRLCSSAGPNQILISNEVKKSLDDSQFIFEDLGHYKLKGFESDLIHVFEVNPGLQSISGGMEKDIHLCPSGHGVLTLDTNHNMIYVFKCRTCGFEKTNSLDPITTKKVA